MKQLHEYETPELNALVKKQHLRMCSSSNDPADLFSEALNQMEDLATSLEQRLAATIQTLERISTFHTTENLAALEAIKNSKATLKLITYERP